MTESTPSSPSSPFEPSPRVRHLITMILRAGVGFPLMNQGLRGFWELQGGNPMGNMGIGGPVPGVDGAYVFVPYIQIVTGLAILVGFLTIVALCLASILTLLPALFQFIAQLTGGAMGYSPFRNRGFPPPGMFEDLLASNHSWNLVLVLALIWLTSIGWNGWSLDGLVFRPSARGTERAAGPKPVAGALE